MAWYNTFMDWISDPANHDQDNTKKTGFVQTAMVGPVTKLSAAGISNGKLKKYCVEVQKANISMDIDELLEGAHYIFEKARFTEDRVAIFFLLERYKKLIKTNSIRVFTEINDRWVDLIDHWTTSDHLCINVFPYLMLNDSILKEIDLWGESQNFWRRRLSITALIKHCQDEEIGLFIIKQVNKQIQDRNYYVRKAIPWLLRTCCKSVTEEVEEYLMNNYHQLSKTELREAMKNLSIDSQAILLDLYEHQ
ncbi:MAG: DNA alkylation repair protein [Candidatus Heimdallarchaeota archaeon]|nr:DNA alkylation repair protein [Candidatus Heimdallarchaeota archaeon]